MTNKKILILGCGYVGSSFALASKSKGNRVFAVTRNEFAANRLRSDGIEVFEGNIQEDRWFDFAGNDVDAILNCVGAGSSDLKGYRTSYIEGNHSWVNWMNLSHFKGNAIYTSSVAVYPDRGGDWVSEFDSRGDRERARILLESEAVFFTGPREASKKVLRLGGIYGPGRSFLIDRIRRGERSEPAKSAYYLNLIRLEDIIAGIEAVFADSNPGSDLYNLVDDEPLLKNELESGLASRLSIGASPQALSEIRARSSRRSDGGLPANRRVSNWKFKQAFGWSPRFPNALDGMLDLVSN